MRFAFRVAAAVGMAAAAFGASANGPHPPNESGVSAPLPRRPAVLPPDLGQTLHGIDVLEQRARAQALAAVNGGRACAGLVRVGQLPASARAQYRCILERMAASSKEQRR